MKISKREEIEKAALQLRVKARRVGYMTEDMSWDVIAEVQSRYDDPPPISARDVIRCAQKHLRENDEHIPVK